MQYNGTEESVAERLVKMGDRKCRFILYYVRAIKQTDPEPHPAKAAL
ncbi:MULTISPECIES: hypothetical protein [Nostocales]